jgi:hypothetical protein
LAPVLRSGEETVQKRLAELSKLGLMWFQPVDKALLCTLWAGSPTCNPLSVEEADIMPLQSRKLTIAASSSVGG